MNAISFERQDPLDERYFGKPIRRHIKEFSVVFSVIFLVIAGVKVFGKSNFEAGMAWSAAAIFMLFLGYKAPKVLHPIWEIWMEIAHRIGMVMTAVILSIAWFLVVVPVALALKAFRVRLMKTEFKQDVKSYWDDRDQKYDDFKLLERQF